MNVVGNVGRATMSLTSWSPWRELETLRERLDRVLTELGRTSREGESSVPVDVQETDDAVIVRASVPGIRPEDLSVEVNQGVLTIRGEIREEHEETRGTWHIRERRIGTIYRSVTLPTPVREEEAQATLEHGVLEIRLPKAEPRIQRRIPVQVR
jgi:HSP20 family protein